VVDAFLAASRHGDFQGLLAVLDPDVVMRADAAAMQLEGTAERRGAQAVAQAFKGRARSAQSALVNGAVGVVVAPRGELLLVLNITVVNDKITAIDAIADPERLAGFDLAVLGT
jgi:RNA polymerase sigma-70 factor (ECF subfamily)